MKKYRNPDIPCVTGRKTVSSQPVASTYYPLEGFDQIVGLPIQNLVVVFVPRWGLHGCQFPALGPWSQLPSYVATYHAEQERADPI